MRETEFKASEHPDFMLSHAAVLTDKRAMDDLIEKLQGGDQTRGWEGDPRLVIAFNKSESRWELWRREHDEQYRLLARSHPGLPFPHSIIDELVERDTRRGFDVKQYVDQHNAHVDLQKEQTLSEAMGPRFERLRWALLKDDKAGAGL